MATIKVPTTFNIDVEFEIPEFYRRMLALLIDMLVEFFYFRIAAWIYDSIASTTSRSLDTDSQYNLWWIGLLFFMPVLVYHLVFEITMNGQSIGKKIMGMRVVNENGGRASMGQFLIRWLLRVSDLWIIMLVFILISNPGFGNMETSLTIIAALVFLITDVILVATSKKSQRIGDILAHTILIRTNPKASIEETVFQEVADTYTPSFPQIMQLSDRDINAIKGILETAKKKNDYNMAAAAADKIKLHLKIDSSLSPFDFLDLLLKDYNYLSVK